MGFDCEQKKNIQTYPTLLSFKEMLNAICQQINEDGYLFQLSSHIVSYFIINFIANIY